jgi:peptidoglycan/xylan/chitin deacetylase (PgdA/CDA1 family)
MRAILTYHSIDDSRSAISVTADTFEKHVRWLGSGAVRVTTVDELLKLPEESDAVALTFDDAFDSVATIAAPRLRHFGLPATVFVVTDHVGRTNRWGGISATGIPVMPLMDWAALGRLAESGFSLGAHSRTHPDLTKVNSRTLRQEVVGSVEKIERETGVRPRSFAYPYGRVNSAVAAIAASVCGHAVTTELRLIAPDEPRLLLPRLDAYYFQAPGRLESWGSPRWLAYLKARSVLRTVRGMVTQ